MEESGGALEGEHLLAGESTVRTERGAGSAGGTGGAGGASGAGGTGGDRRVGRGW